MDVFTAFLPLLELIGIAAAVFFVLWSIKQVVFLLANSKAEKGVKAAVVAKQFAASLNGIFLLAFSLFIAGLWIDVGENLNAFFKKASWIGIIVLSGLFANNAAASAIDYFSNHYREKKGMSFAVFTLFATFSKVAIFAIVALFILDNLNFEVTSLLAGLGIGGIAIALAAQNILQDLFASLSIIIDKPFVIGDFINVDQYLGKVEYIGIKTTRIRSLGGEQVVFSNSDILKCRLRNFKRMQERRVAFTLKVACETPVQKIQEIPHMLKEIISLQPEARFDRAHFKEFGNYSLDFEIVFFVLSSSYKTFMDVQEKINVAIVEKFSQEHIALAYPTSRSIRVEP